MPGLAELGYDRFVQVVLDENQGPELFKDIAQALPEALDGVDYAAFRSMVATAPTARPTSNGPAVTLEQRLMANVAIGTAAIRQQNKKLDEAQRKREAELKTKVTPEQAAAVFGSQGRNMPQEKPPSDNPLTDALIQTGEALLPTQKVPIPPPVQASNQAEQVLNQRIQAEVKAKETERIRAEREAAGQPPLDLFEGLLAGEEDQYRPDPNYVLFHADINGLGAPELDQVYAANKAVFEDTLVPQAERMKAMNRATLALVAKTNIKLAPDQYGRLPDPQVDRAKEFVRYFDPQTGVVRSMPLLKWITPQKMTTPSGVQFIDSPDNVYRQIQSHSYDEAMKIAEQQGVKLNGTNASFGDVVRSRIGSFRQGLTMGVWGLVQGAGQLGAMTWNAMVSGAQPGLMQLGVFDDFTVPVFDNQFSRAIDRQIQQDLKTIGEITPQLGGLENDLTAQVLNALGQGSVSLALGFAGAPGLGATLASRGAAAVAGLSASGTMAKAGYDDAIAELSARKGEENLTASDYESAAALGYANFGIGLTESITLLQLGRFFPGGPAAFTRKLFSGGGRPMLTVARNLANTSATSGFEEMFQGAASDFAANEILDLNRNWLDPSKRLREGGVGAITGGVLAGSSFFISGLANVKLRQHKAYQSALISRGVEPGTPEAVEVARETSTPPDVVALGEAQVRELEEIVAAAEVDEMSTNVDGLRRLRDLGAEETTSTTTSDATQEGPVQESVPAQPEAPIERGSPDETSVGDSLPDPAQVEESQVATPPLPQQDSEPSLTSPEGAQVEAAAARLEAQALADTIQEGTAGEGVTIEEPKAEDFQSVAPDTALAQYADAVLREQVAVPLQDAQTDLKAFAKRLLDDAPVIKLPDGRVVDLESVSVKQLRELVKPLFDSATERVMVRRAQRVEQESPAPDAQVLAAQETFNNLVPVAPDVKGLRNLRNQILERQKQAESAFFEGVKSHRETLRPVADFVDTLLKDPEAMPVTGQRLSAAAKRRLRLIRNAANIHTANDAATVIDQVEALLESEEVAGLYDQADAIRASIRKEIAKKPKGQASGLGLTVREALAGFRSLNPGKLTTVEDLTEYIRRGQEIQGLLRSKSRPSIEAIQDSKEWALGKIQKLRMDATERARALYAARVNAGKMVAGDASEMAFVEHYLFGTPIPEEFLSEKPQSQDATERPDPLGFVREQVDALRQDLGALDVMEYTERESEIIRSLLAIDPAKITDKPTLVAYQRSLYDVVEANDFTNAGRIALQAVANERLLGITQRIAALMKEAGRKLPRSLNEKFARGVADFMTVQVRTIFISPVLKAANDLRAQFIAPIEQGQVKTLLQTEEVGRGFIELANKIPKDKVAASLKRARVAAILIQRFDGPPEKQAQDIQRNRKRFEESIQRKLISTSPEVVNDGRLDQEAYQVFENAGNSAEGIREVLAKADPDALRLMDYTIDAYAKRREEFLSVQENVFGKALPVVLDYTPFTFYRSTGDADIQAIDLTKPETMRQSDVDIEAETTGAGIAREATQRLPDGKVFNTNAIDLVSSDYYKYAFDTNTLEARAIVSRMLAPQFSLDGAAQYGAFEKTIGRVQLGILKSMAIQVTDNSRRQAYAIGGGPNTFDLAGLTIALGGYDQLVKQAAPVMADASARAIAQYGVVNGLGGIATSMARIGQSRLASMGRQVAIRMQQTGKSLGDAMGFSSEGTGHNLEQVAGYYDALIAGMKKAGAATVRRASIGASFSIDNIDPDTMRGYAELYGKFSTAASAVQRGKRFIDRQLEGGLKLFMGNSDRYAALAIWVNKYVNELRTLKPDANITHQNFDPVAHLLRATDVDPQTGQALLTQAELSRLVSDAEAEVSLISNESNPSLQSNIMRAAMGGNVRRGSAVEGGAFAKAMTSRIMKSILLFSSHEMSQITRRYTAAGHLGAALGRGDFKGAGVAFSDLGASAVSIITYQAIVAFLLSSLRDMEELAAEAYIEAVTGEPYLNAPELDAFARKSLEEYEADRSMDRFLTMSVAQLVAGPLATPIAGAVKGLFPAEKTPLGREIEEDFNPVYTKKGSFADQAAQVLGSAGVTAQRAYDGVDLVLSTDFDSVSADQQAQIGALVVLGTIGTRFGLGASVYNTMAKMARQRQRLAGDTDFERKTDGEGNVNYWDIQQAREPKLQEALEREAIREAERLVGLPAQEVKNNIEIIRAGLELSMGKERAEEIVEDVVFNYHVIRSFPSDPKQAKLLKKYSEKYQVAKTTGRRREVLEKYIEGVRDAFGEDEIPVAMERLLAYKLLDRDTYEALMGDPESKVKELRARIEERMRPKLEAIELIRNGIMYQRLGPLGVPQDYLLEKQPDAQAPRQ